MFKNFKYKKLNNNIDIPILGFGTLGLTGEKGIEAIINAIKSGYRHIDTAQVYGSECEVGKAVQYCIENNIVKREELFITSKIDPHKPIGYKQGLSAVHQSLKKMGLDYIDLYLIHYPNVAPNSEWKRLNQETWHAFEECVEKGLIKSIGVSNFEIHHLEELLKTAKIKPVVNQINLSPTWQQKPLVKFCKDNNIVCVSWSVRIKPFDIVNDLLGRKVYGDVEDLLTPVLDELAQKYKKTQTQISIKWCLQKGFVPITKTSNIERLIENQDVFDFEIEKSDIEKLDVLNSRPAFPDFAPDISYTVWAYQQKLSEYEIKTQQNIKLLGFPFIKYNYISDEIQIWKLFGFINFIKTVKNNNKIKYYLFNFLPFIKRILGNGKEKIYLFGIIPIFKIEKEIVKKYKGIQLIPDYTEIGR